MDYEKHMKPTILEFKVVIQWMRQYAPTYIYACHIPINISENIVEKQESKLVCKLIGFIR